MYGTKFKISVKIDAMTLLHQFAYGYIRTIFEEAYNSIPYIMTQTAVWTNKLFLRLQGAFPM